MTMALKSIGISSPASGTRGDRINIVTEPLDYDEIIS